MAAALNAQHRIARELALLVAAAAALGLGAWFSHGLLGVWFVAACCGAGAAAVVLTDVLTPKATVAFAPVVRYAVGGLLRTVLLLLVPIFMIDRQASGQGTLVLYAFAMLVVVLGAEVREAARLADSPPHANNAR